MLKQMTAIVHGLPFDEFVTTEGPTKRHSWEWRKDGAADCLVRKTVARPVEPLGIKFENEPAQGCAARPRLAYDVAALPEDDARGSGARLAARARPPSDHICSTRRSLTPAAAELVSRAPFSVSCVSSLPTILPAPLPPVIAICCLHGARLALTRSLVCGAVRTTRRWPRLRWKRPPRRPRWPSPPLASPTRPTPHILGTRPPLSSQRTQARRHRSCEPSAPPEMAGTLTHDRQREAVQTWWDRIARRRAAVARGTYGCGTRSSSR